MAAPEPLGHGGCAPERDYVSKVDHLVDGRPVGLIQRRQQTNGTNEEADVMDRTVFLNTHSLSASTRRDKKMKSELSEAPAHTQSKQLNCNIVTEKTNRPDTQRMKSTKFIDRLTILKTSSSIVSSFHSFIMPISLSPSIHCTNGNKQVERQTEASVLYS